MDGGKVQLPFLVSSVFKMNVKYQYEEITVGV